MKHQQLYAEIKGYIAIVLLSIDWALVFVLFSAILPFNPNSISWQAFLLASFLIGVITFLTASLTVKFTTENMDWLFGKKKEEQP